MAQWIYTHDPNYRSARVDDQGRSRRVRYQVQTDVPDADEAEIQEDSGFRWGDADPLDSTRFLRSIEVNRDGTNPYYWELILEYRSETIQGYSPELSQIPPIQRSPEFEWNYEEVLENVDRDVHGDPICTLSGEVPDPPIQRPFADLVASVTFFRESWNAALMLGLVNTVNSDVWYGWPAKTVRSCSPRARLVVEPPWPPCYQITYTFKCRPDGWTVKFFHAGYKHWTGEVDSNGDKIFEPNKDADGVLYETPQPLDEEGKLIKMLANGTYEKNWVVRFVDLYEAVPFAQFGV